LKADYELSALRANPLNGKNLSLLLEFVPDRKSLNTSVLVDGEDHDGGTTETN